MLRMTEAERKVRCHHFTDAILAAVKQMGLFVDRNIPTRGTSQYLKIDDGEYWIEVRCSDHPDPFGYPQRIQAFVTKPPAKAIGKIAKAFGKPVPPGYRIGE